jgi:hypothetical protein
MCHTAFQIILAIIFLRHLRKIDSRFERPDKRTITGSSIKQFLTQVEIINQATLVRTLKIQNRNKINQINDQIARK